MDAKTTYYTITTDLWKMFRSDFEQAAQEHDAETWLALVGKYDAIWKKYRHTPYERYASEMILAHVHELERIWRDNFFEGIKTE